MGAKGEAASQYIYTSIPDNVQDRPSILYVYLLSLCLFTLRFCCVVLCAATPVQTEASTYQGASKALTKKARKNIGLIGYVTFVLF